MDLKSAPPELLKRYPALRRPLVFGDLEQIAALAELELDLEAEQYVNWAHWMPVPDGCNEYVVRVLVDDRHAETIVVVAKDREQAARVARIAAERRFSGEPFVVAVAAMIDKLRVDIASLAHEQTMRRRAEKRVHDLVNTLQSILAAGADYPRVEALVTEALDSLATDEPGGKEAPVHAGQTPRGELWASSG